MTVKRLVAFGLGASMLAGTAFAQGDDVFPPWQEGKNNDVQDRGLEFRVPEADNLADFHGSPMDPLLVLYVGGNDFFAMAPPVRAFEESHPEFKGRLYWQTIPPGLLVRQMEAGGTITVGNMAWTARAGVTWKSEAIFQEEVDNPIESVDIPDNLNSTGTYAGAVRKGAAHPKAARLWLDFIRSDKALRIFERYGFERYDGDAR